MSGKVVGEQESPIAKPTSWRGQAVQLAAIVGIVFVAKGAIAEPFYVPSGSMEPTLLVGDYLFVSKWSYGYSRHSLPFSMPLIPDGKRIFFTEPVRGDVAVFKLPADGKTDYIKRLIGLPGDRIQVTGGILHINGQPVQRERIGDGFQGNGRGIGAMV